MQPAEPSEGGGDAGLLRTLFQEHSRAVLAFTLRLTGDRFAAEDIVQEVFLRAWQNTAELREVRSVRAWLFTVARNLFIDRVRAKAARPAEVTDLSSVPLASKDHAEGVVDSMIVYEAMGELTPEHRAVLVQLYYLGRTVSEASRALGVPEGTVKSRSYHALRAFRRTIGSGTKEPTG